MKRRHFRHQPRLPGQIRTPMHTCVLHSIELHIQRDMKRFRVSRSFVIAVALAYHYGIELSPKEKL